MEQIFFVRCCFIYLFFHILINHVFILEESQKDQQEENVHENEEIQDDYYTLRLHNEDIEEDSYNYVINFENMTVLGMRSVFTYLEIIPTPLVPTIVYGGASYIVRGFGQSVSLEPAILTVDPDYPDEGVSSECMLTFFKNEDI